MGECNTAAPSTAKQRASFSISFSYLMFSFSHLAFLEHFQSFDVFISGCWRYTLSITINIPNQVRTFLCTAHHFQKNNNTVIQNKVTHLLSHICANVMEWVIVAILQGRGKHRVYSFSGLMWLIHISPSKNTWRRGLPGSGSASSIIIFLHLFCSGRDRSCRR